MALAPLDVIFLAIVGLAAIRCAMRGFVAEVMSVAAIIGGVVAAIFLSGPLARYIGQHYGDSVWNRIIAFLAIFVCCYLIVKIFERAIYRVVDGINLDKLDRALGFFLGVAEGLLVVVIVVLVMEAQPFFKVDNILAASRAAVIIMKLFPVQPIIQGVTSV
ncbi:MAG TPA: CvpA family protein [Spirochaetia bacterium]|nr:CvpA family protein [Spirochaetia bacterium]